ncbi:MAG: hypothetical protein NTV40_02785 [Solirubrobacterales bacterium]|nr:hypothetical protein [Solirubrobacterales bacterium]
MTGGGEAFGQRVSCLFIDVDSDYAGAFGAEDLAGHLAHTAGRPTDDCPFCFK